MLKQLTSLQPELLRPKRLHMFKLKSSKAQNQRPQSQGLQNQRPQSEELQNQRPQNEELQNQRPQSQGLQNQKPQNNRRRHLRLQLQGPLKQLQQRKRLLHKCLRKRLCHLISSTTKGQVMEKFNNFSGNYKVHKQGLNKCTFCSDLTICGKEIQRKR